MSKRARITTNIIDRVWELHDCGYSNEYISANLGISSLSTQRCILAMTIAKQGKVVKYEGILKDTHHIADYANKMFKTNSVNQVKEDKDNSQLINAINRLADNIARQNNLIERAINKFR